MAKYLFLNFEVFALDIFWLEKTKKKTAKANTSNFEVFYFAVFSCFMDIDLA